MLSINKINKQALIEYEDFLFMYVEEESAFDSEKMFYVDAIIINSSETKLFEKVLRVTRTHYDAEIYLKPIFCVQYEGLPIQVIERCDGLTDVTQYQKIARTTREIKTNIEKLFLQQKFPSNEFGVLYKAMQYLYTRNHDLIPFVDRHARLSYTYPFVSMQLEDEEQNKIIDILKQGVRQGFLREEQMLDKIHVCDACHSAHHNIRETCLHCNGLICPKCQKILRHIGVDYDKPSHIFNCNTCSEHFQNPVFTYNCVDCGKVSDIRHLQEHLIRRVSLTAKGKQLVLSGLPKKNYESGENSKEVTGVYDLSVFKNILQQEKARTAFNPGRTFFGKVTVVDAQLNSQRKNDPKR